mmetsp:Transcript_11913/g.30030  ORF Transcript_11913/g.30030 Transcript_11913/m.30030 type:complete len:221 (+) Transcript_11913:1901-2563(+)
MQHNASSSSSSSSAIALARSLPGDSATIVWPPGDFLCCMPMDASISSRLRCARSRISAWVLLRSAATDEAVPSPPAAVSTSSKPSARPPTRFSLEQPSRPCSSASSSGRPTKLAAVAASPLARAVSRRSAAGTPGRSSAAAQRVSRRRPPLLPPQPAGSGDCGAATGLTIGVDGLAGTDCQVSFSAPFMGIALLTAAPPSNSSLPLPGAAYVSAGNADSR